MLPKVTKLADELEALVLASDEEQEPTAGGVGGEGKHGIGDLPVPRKQPTSSGTGVGGGRGLGRSDVRSGPPGASERSSFGDGGMAGKPAAGDKEILKRPRSLVALLPKVRESADKLEALLRRVDSDMENSGG